MPLKILNEGPAFICFMSKMPQLNKVNIQQSIDDQ